MLDILQPRTDGGVAIQLAIFAITAATVLVVVRRRREWLLLVTGVTVLGLSLFGVRALH